jgi:phenylacetate-CoA ligase
MMFRVRSAVPEIVWPAVPSAEGATALAVQFQLERTQWLPPERLRELQFRQLDPLVRHAYATVPYYRERWRGFYDPDAALTPDRFARLPLLARHDLQAAYDVLKSENVPPAHGFLAESRTSGSTGTPVRVLKTALNELWWRAFTLRDHRWHRRDVSGKLAAIRHKVVTAEADGWGPATDAVLVTGRSATLPISVDMDSQLEWLLAQKPDYVLTYPSNAAELAKRSLARGVRLHGLREVRTMGEVLATEVRELCRQAWDVPVTDTYSADEVGYIALQCPACEQYHVQSEGVLVEVLDPAGQPCEPGKMGRVVVTALHSYAMPLVRYELGDYAEIGAACVCGRGLPVLARVIGRARNILVLADGRRYWPNFGSRGLNEIAPVLQHQFVQRSHDTIEARLVTAAPLTPEQEDGLRRHFLSRLPARFDIRFVYLPEIPRSASGKYEDFVSEIA